MGQEAERVTQPRQPWKETIDEFAARLRGICQYVNNHYDAEGLCSKFHDRIQEVIDAEGDRISA